MFFPHPPPTFAQCGVGRYKNDFSDEMRPSLGDRLRKPPPKRMADHVRRRKVQKLYQEPDIIRQQR